MCFILIVDDHDDVRGAISTALREVGHEVELATDGDEALSWLSANAEKPPCLIILDLRMPKMDGWDFLQTFRERPACAHLPVIVLSALDQTGPVAGLERASLLVKARRSQSARKRSRALSDASPIVAARQHTSLSPHRRRLDHRSKGPCQAFRLVGSLEVREGVLASAALSVRGG